MSAETGTLVVYTTTHCSDCSLTAAVLAETRTPYRHVNLDDSPEAVPTVMALNGGYCSVPTLVFPDGRVLVEPSRPELLEALKAQPPGS
ncbi:MAG: glutaredoxin family protein [Candidatus Dormibacteraeota bacterium]|nr:glutaredoxin family protein [Candidatus Dormibacteraeota bacterium]